VYNLNTGVKVPMAETEDHSDVAVAELNFRHALHPGEDSE